MAQGRGHHGQGKSVNPGVDRATDARGTARRLRTKGLRLLEVVRPHGGWDSPIVYCPLGQDPSAAEGGVKAAPVWGPRGAGLPWEQFQGLTLSSENGCGGLGTQTHWAATVSLLLSRVLSFAYGCPGPLPPCPWLSRSGSSPCSLLACTGAVGGDWGQATFNSCEQPRSLPRSPTPVPCLSPLLEGIYRLS